MVQFHPGVLHNYNPGGAMALSHRHGTNVRILKGGYKGKTGTVNVMGKLKTVVLEDGTELMGVDDSMVRKVD